MVRSFGLSDHVVRQSCEGIEARGRPPPPWASTSPEKIPLKFMAARIPPFVRLKEPNRLLGENFR